MANNRFALPRAIADGLIDEAATAFGTTPGSITREQFLQVREHVAGLALENFSWAVAIVMIGYLKYGSYTAKDRVWHDEFVRFLNIDDAGYEGTPLDSAEKDSQLRFARDRAAWAARLIADQSRAIYAWLVATRDCRATIAYTEMLDAAIQFWEHKSGQSTDDT